MMYSGSCLCGSIKYEVNALEERMGHCHCSMCRKFHGAAFATFGEAKTKNFKWVMGQELLKSYIADNGSTRQFCSNCGSSMTFAAADNNDCLVTDTGLVNNKGLIEFALGTLDSNIPNKADAHLYTEFKAAWFDISDELPVFIAGREKLGNA